MTGRLDSSCDESNTAGPLQDKVNSPNFTDWQNIDWSTLATSETVSAPGGYARSPIDGSNGLFESSSGFVSVFCDALYLITQ